MRYFFCNRITNIIENRTHLKRCFPNKLIVLAKKKNQVETNTMIVKIMVKLNKNIEYSFSYCDGGFKGTKFVCLINFEENIILLYG